MTPLPPLCHTKKRRDKARFFTKKKRGNRQETMASDRRVSRLELKAAAARAAARNAPSLDMADLVNCHVHHNCTTLGRVDPEGFHVLILDKRNLLFRGASGSSVLHLLPPDKPVFMGNVETAFHSYAEDQDDRCDVFRLRRNVELLDMSDLHNIRELTRTLRYPDDHLFGIYTGYGRTNLTRDDAWSLDPQCIYRDKDPTAVRLCTSGYMTSEDEKKREHISLRVARAICAMGFDGWIIGTSHMRAGGSHFHPEVMLCRPNDLLIPLEDARCSEYAKERGQRREEKTPTWSLQEWLALLLSMPRPTFKLRGEREEEGGPSPPLCPRGRDEETREKRVI